MFKLKKKAFNKNRSDLAKRIKTAIIIKKLTIALKLGLPIRGRIKDCKFIWTAFTRTVPRKTNPKSTSEPKKPKKKPHKAARRTGLQNNRSITEKTLFLMSREQNILNCAYSTIRLVKAPAEVSL